MKKRVLLTSIITFAAIVLTFGIFAIPGQYAHPGAFDCNGYEMIFNFKVIDGINYLSKNYPGSRPSVAGIIALVLMLIASSALFFAKKDKALPLLGSIAVFISGILLLTMNAWLTLIYKTVVNLKWATYVCGGVLTALSVYLFVISIMYIKEPSTVDTKEKKYSYLKSNKNKD